jgi:regulator of protease activity HflC (stomatin/prohibitin superfamily)
MATLAKRILPWLSRHFLDVAVVSLLFILTLIYFYPFLVATVGPGEAGVVWDRFFGGTRVNVVYGEGIHFLLPWNRFYKYDVRIQTLTREYQAYSQSGLPITIEMSIRFRPAGAPFENPVNRGPSGENSVAELHKRVGPDYAEKLIIPMVGAALRTVVGRYTADNLYHSQHQSIQDQVIDVIADRRHNEQFADERLVDIIDVPVRTITLPDSVRKAIEAKLAEEQAVLAYDFTIEKEQKEAVRKAVEAEGVRKFQDVIASRLTPGFLQYKSIEAILQLAKSQNAKVVVIGGKDGAPIMLSVPPDAK